MNALESINTAELRHSLRTPLNHVIGYCEMLLEAEGAPAAPLRSLVFEARELVRLIQNFKPENENVSSAELHALQVSCVPFIGRMTAEIHQLSQTASPALQEDVERIRSAVERLSNFAADHTDAMAALSASSSGALRLPVEGGAREGGRGSLLIVDDSAENRDILCRHLEREGYGVTAVSRGASALELLRTNGFELVLLDVLMPDMDGFEVLRQMKEDPALRATPVVMISALDETGGAVRCIQMGAEDYLTKPFDPVLLAARIGASLEKKRLRDEERRRAEELERLLDQLRRTQDQLVVQENLASLGALTAGIAHEIRNPLNFINNFAILSKDLVDEIRPLLPDPDTGGVRPLFDQLEQCVAKIDEHGTRADRIVRAMLMHSRGKCGDPETVDMKFLLSDTVNLAFHSWRAQNRQFNLRIEMDFDPETGTVRAVPQEIGRVFLNIVNNAFYAVWERKKTEDESFQPAVAVRTRNLGDTLEIRVIDNGPGIPAEVQPKIFSPFFTTKPAGAGTGLGLSLSHDIIVRGHHGTIRAQSNPGVSNPGVSTEFIVTLPRGNA